MAGGGAPRGGGWGRRGGSVPGAPRDLRVQALQDPELAQLIAAVEPLLDALARPAPAQRLPAQPVPLGFQLTDEPALDGDLAQRRGRGAQLGGHFPLRASVFRPERADQIALAPRQLAL